MAFQRFDSAFREAIWSAYDSKCFHCGRHIPFLELEIDHLIPESLADKPEELARVLEEIGLPSEFNVLGHENIVPSCRPCNGTKSDIALYAGSLKIALAKVRQKLPRLRGELAKERSKQELGKIFAAITRSMAGGKFTHAEFVEQVALLPKPAELAEEPGLRIEFAEKLTIEEEPTVVFANQASASMKRRNVSETDVYRTLYYGLTRETSNVRIVPGNPPRYVVRMRPDIRIVFEREGNVIRILTVFRKEER